MLALLAITLILALFIVLGIFALLLFDVAFDMTGSQDTSSQTRGANHRQRSRRSRDKVPHPSTPSHRVMFDPRKVEEESLV